MKIVLAGSPEISVDAFEKVINNFEVVAIVTQPDRPKGRGMKMYETPVSLLGKKYEIKTFKPEKIGNIYEELKSLDFDILLTFAFGQYIPLKILELGKYKPVNIHGSLLPKYRGAAPIHYAILNGDKEIGITLIEMTKEMDAGDMFFKAKQKIDDSTTTGDAFNIISQLASEHIVDWLNKIKTGDFKTKKQSGDFSLSPKIEKSFGLIDQNTTVKEAKRKILGLNPFPGSFTIIDGKRVKLFSLGDKKKNSLILKLVDGEIYINKYQYQSKKVVII